MSYQEQYSYDYQDYYQIYDNRASTGIWYLDQLLQGGSARGRYT
jgi:hypothetical protein